jgi:hypothetical protein
VGGNYTEAASRALVLRAAGRCNVTVTLGAHCWRSEHQVMGSTMQMSRQSQVRLISALMIALALAACGSVHSTYVADGRRGFVITCGGFLNSWSSCLVKAGRACGNRGYETIKGNEEDRSMMIACRVPDAASAPTQAAH